MHPGTGVQNRKQRHAIGFTLPLRKAAQGASITGEFAIISAAKRCNPHERVKPMYGTAEIAQKRPPLIACGVVRKLVPEHMGKHAGLLQRRVIYENCGADEAAKTGRWKPANEIHGQTACAVHSRAGMMHPTIKAEVDKTI